MMKRFLTTCSILTLLTTNMTGTQDTSLSAPRVLQPLGYTTLGWIFHQRDKDLFERWTSLDGKVKVAGSVQSFLDWDQVDQITVLHNQWHLPGGSKDIRVEHVKTTLLPADFGIRVKAFNPGGLYVFLLRYRDSDRQVLLSFVDGVFLVEDQRRIGAVDTRRKQ